MTLPWLSAGISSVETVMMVWPCLPLLVMNSLPAWTVLVTEAVNSCSPEVLSAGTLRYRSVPVGMAFLSTALPSLSTSSYLSSLVSLAVGWLDSKRIGPTLPSVLASLRAKGRSPPLIPMVGWAGSFSPPFFSPSS